MKIDSQVTKIVPIALSRILLVTIMNRLSQAFQGQFNKHIEEISYKSLDSYWESFKNFMLDLRVAIGKDNPCILKISTSYFNKENLNINIKFIIPILFILLQERNKQTSPELWNKLLSDKTRLEDIFWGLLAKKKIYIDFSTMNIIETKPITTFKEPIPTFINSRCFKICQTFLLLRNQFYHPNENIIQTKMAKHVMTQVLEACSRNRAIEDQECREVLKRMDKDAECLKDPIARLSSDLNTQKKLTNKLIIEVNDMRKEMAHYVEENTHLKQENSELKKENSQLKQVYAQIIKSNRKEITHLAKENMQIRAENTQIRAENTKLKEEVAQIRAENTQIRAENTQIRAENTKLKEEVAQIRAENMQLKQENTQLKEEVAQIREENTQLKEEVAQMKEAQKCQDEKIVELTEEITTLKGLIFDMRGTINELYKQLNQYKVTLSKEESNTNKNESLSRKILIRKYVTNIVKMIFSLLKVEESATKDDILFAFNKSYLCNLANYSPNDIFKSFVFLLKTKNELNDLFHNNKGEQNEPSTLTELVRLIAEEYNLSAHLFDILNEFLNNLTKGNIKILEKFNIY